MNQILQKELKKNGFVIIPFLNSEEVSALNSFYDDVHDAMEPPTFIENIHMTSWCGDFDYKKKVTDGLARLFAPASERFFKDYRAINNLFIVKRSGTETNFKVHQDWSVVDEKQYESLNVWVPLHDVDENSGALWVLKGSHVIDRKIRGSGYLFPDYSVYLKELEKRAVSVRLKAGEAIVFYHSVIHGSPPNLATTQRKVACFSVIPKDASLSIYYQPQEGLPLELHVPPDDFIFRYSHLRTETTLRPPTDKPAKVMPTYVNKKVAMKELEPFLENKKSFFSFLRK